MDPKLKISVSKHAELLMWVIILGIQFLHHSEAVDKDDLSSINRTWYVTKHEVMTNTGD